MRPSDVLQTLIELIPTREPVMLWGPPGVGKSQLAEQATLALQRQFLVRSVPYMDAVDAGGFPMPNGETMKFTRPDFCPATGEGVAFLDELPMGVPLVQGSLCQFIQTRRVRDHVLGDGWTVLAAGNRAEDRAGANRLITPILNRLIHIDVEVSYEDWHSWALKSGIQGEVLAYLRFTEGAGLFSFNPTRNERAFPTPRSWAKLSAVLPAIHADRLMSVASGTIGEAEAAKFCGYIRYYREMPDLEQALQNPEKYPVPREAGVLWAVSTALVLKVKSAGEDLLRRAVKYITRLPSEFSILTMQDVCSLNKAIYKIPEGVAWLAKHREFLGTK